MMIKLLLALLLFAIPIFTVPKPSAQGQPKDDFVIQYADATNTLSMTSSPDLNALITNVASRFVLQYANANRYVYLVPAPAELLTLIGQVDDRFLMSYANANKFYSLTYPVDLVGDNIPPQAGIPTVTPSGFSTVKITWTTNEYTTSIIAYGIQSGVYPQNVTDSLLKKQHEIVLSGLAAGETYYYRISDTDRSGNTYQSQERSFTSFSFMYLPLIKR